MHHKGKKSGSERRGVFAASSGGSPPPPQSCLDAALTRREMFSFSIRKNPQLRACTGCGSTGISMGRGGEATYVALGRAFSPSLAQRNSLASRWGSPSHWNRPERSRFQPVPGPLADLKTQRTEMQALPWERVWGAELVRETDGK